MQYFKQYFSLITLVFCLSCDTGQAINRPPQAVEEQQQDRITAPARVQNFSFQVVNSYPHDPDAFTQGLVFHQGLLYESTGLNTRSSIRKVDLQTGEVIKKVDIESQFFGEGLALFNRRAYQLTWQSQRGFIYDPETLQLINTFSYTGEGWGLTNNESSLIMSDGTNRIRFLNPDTFEVQRIISVYDGSKAIDNLNELEYIKGEIYANVWQTDRIARIDPQNGRITAWIDLSGLLPPEDRRQHVDWLNGIAYDESSDRIFVTGKLWPKLFEIKLKPRRVDVSR